ncbi:hypothetical protein F8388_023669 [Cannabis sativa]|uniref:pectinesterase n=1 Tax=Cannabis sativa TaxID=3483 RepID=A0A7J6GA04_CANSA|nr:hypothetical protein F8388_023669 [Cannabis sativa]
MENKNEKKEKKKKTLYNSSPLPKGKLNGEQAVAMRISGDKAAFHNCKFVGFQDTLCDDKGRHFFSDCYG